MKTNNLENAIINHRLIDINLFDEQITYTGICLLASKKIVVIVNYNNKLKIFDGFSIFRNENFDSFETWKKKWIKYNYDNSMDFIKRYNVNKLRTFYSWFKQLANKGFVAFFTDNDLKTYYVGKITEVDAKKIKVNLVDKKGNFISRKVFNIVNINYFSFDTGYETKLFKKVIPYLEPK